MYWFEKAAMNNYPDAQYDYSQLIEDKDQSFYWLTLASENEHPCAKLKLGLHYCDPKNPINNEKKGVSLIFEAANSGNAHARWKESITAGSADDANASRLL